MTPLSGGADDLPPLPEPDGSFERITAEYLDAKGRVVGNTTTEEDAWSADAMQAYARQAIESDRARRQEPVVPDELRLAAQAMVDDWDAAVIDPDGCIARLRAALSLKGAKE